jgi:hypothetical protein
MAGWTQLPCDEHDTIEVAWWTELRAAMAERDGLAWAITLPTAMTADTPIGLIKEYQDAVKALVGDSPGAETRSWADTEANNFLTFVTGATATGKKNVFERALAGGAETDFTVDEADTLDAGQWNEQRSVLNLLIALKVDVLDLAGVGATSAGYSNLKGTFAAARTAAFALENAGGGAFAPPADLWFGRYADADPMTTYTCGVQTVKEVYQDVDTSFLSGLTIEDAWVLVQTFETLSGTGYTSKTVNFDIEVGPVGSLVGCRSMNTTAAADITGFGSPSMGYGTDVWKADVDPSDVNQSGNTRVQLRFTDDETLDDTNWTDPTKGYANCALKPNPTSGAVAWLVVHIGMDYGAVFDPEVFDPEVFS